MKNLEYSKIIKIIIPNTIPKYFIKYNQGTPQKMFKYPSQKQLVFEFPRNFRENPEQKYK
jgi:hypothetical protein